MKTILTFPFMLFRVNIPPMLFLFLFKVSDAYNVILELQKLSSSGLFHVTNDFEIDESANCIFFDA